MAARLAPLAWLAPPLAFLLYCFGIDSAGLLGPDEPRYASIGRAMAQTGDWITPRLWGAPWFEKPALLYWMSGAAFRLGLGPDLAPRLPVALLSLAFLAFFWWMARRQFGCAVAWTATLILGSSAGWCLYSESGVTDIPLSATFSAAMLIGLAWVAKRDTRLLPLAGALFGLAVLAKGPIGLILAAPLALRWRHLPDWLNYRVLLPFSAVSLPWYLLCYLRNGPPFLNEFFWRHNFGRFTSPELQHGQPWWFYLPVLAVLFLPWTPVILRYSWRGIPNQPGGLYLALWALWPLLFFSISVNKLPGYILPALPAFALLAAIGLAEAPAAGAWLAGSALLTAAFAAVGPMIDIGGIARGLYPVFTLVWLVAPAAAVAAWFLSARGKRLAAVAVVAVSTSIGIADLKLEIGRKFFARELSMQVKPRMSETCVGRIDRSWRYGLNYYVRNPLPDCDTTERPLRLQQSAAEPPRIETNSEFHAAVDPR